MPSMQSLLIRLAVLVGLGALATGGGIVARDRFAPRGALPGLTVDGAVAPTGEKELRAFVARRAEQVRGREVKVRVLAGAEGDVATEAHTLGELGVVIDVERVVRRALDLEQNGDLLERIDLARQARAGAIDVPLSVTIDPAAALGVVARLKELSDRAPVSARLDLDRGRVIPEVAGRYVDPWASMTSILRAAMDPSAADVILPVMPFPARHRSELLEHLDVSTTLGEYDTYFSRRGDQERRGANIDVAASKVDGLVILPGELVSFNAVVGERSEDNGFAKSWEIYKGEMVEGVGGGTCQVASTFHAAAFFGGLDVVERLPHSRPSAYIPMGLDATVVYPIVDLKVRNPYDFPVVMHAKVDGNRLRMQLLGARKVARVGFARELLETYAYKRKVSEETKLSWSKRVVLKQHGIRGYRVKRIRTLLFADGRVKREQNVDTYPSTTEIYEVPPGFDVDLLPPLPEEDRDEGEGSDTSVATAASAGAPAPPSTGAATPSAVASPGAAVTGPASITLADGTVLDVQLAPGAHAPTHAQADPPKVLKMTR